MSEKSFSLILHLFVSLSINEQCARNASVRASLKSFRRFSALRLESAGGSHLQLTVAFAFCARNERTQNTTRAIEGIEGLCIESVHLRSCPPLFFSQSCIFSCFDSHAFLSYSTLARSWIFLLSPKLSCHSITSISLQLCAHSNDTRVVCAAAKTRYRMRPAE